MSELRDATAWVFSCTVVVTALNRTQTLNARAALSTACAGVLAAIRLGVDAFLAG